MASSSSPTTPSVIWRIVALDTPAVRRRCPGCNGPRPFRSSDKFRVNANQRRIDVWLIYRCVDCEATWNRTVVERARPDDIAPDDYRAYLHNDADAAWRIAFDHAHLHCVGTIPVRVERPALPPEPFRVRFEVRYGCDARLDRLVASELGLSRSQLQRRVAAGTVRTASGGAKAWRRTVRAGTELELGFEVDPG